MYRILLSRSAEKEYVYLHKTNASLFKRIKTALNYIAQNPHQGKPLKLSLKDKWSYRVGMYQIIYSVEYNILTVYVLEIGHRREVYR